MNSPRYELSDAAALRLVVEGTASETGADFFRALVRNLAEVMTTTGAWVTEYEPQARRLRAMAFWIGGRFIEDFEYDIEGTVCEVVVESKKLIHIPDRLVELYQGHPDLRPHNPVSYLGVPLLGSQGEVMGHLSVLDSKPLPADPRLISLFEIFAARAGAEQRRLREEQEVRLREEQLTALLESAMDGVVVLDAAGRIVRVNPAAERLFGCTSEDLLGECLADFLPPESAGHFGALVKELDVASTGQKPFWLPQSFMVLRWDKSPFPAEATVSRFVNRGLVFHTVILRNVDERLAAEQRILLLTQEAEFLRDSVREFTGMGAMLGASPAMNELFESLKRVAVTDATVLIFGETGTGKELIAHSIHQAGLRRDKSLVRVNCAAIPGALMESEFFGHERGAFTGATSRREGRFALADGGTIFLDEVGELPLDLQAKLLRVLQEGEFEPLGSTRTHKVDVRVIAATNRDLGRMVKEGEFREDLYYRLNVFPLRVPPLRERGSDTVLLATEFAQRFGRRMGRRLASLSLDDIRRLQNYRWPGNVRELQNVIERAIILSSGAQLELARAMPETLPVSPPEAGTTNTTETRILSSQEFEALERANIERALAVCGGKVSGESGAANRLGLPPSTLASRMKALGIQRPA
ncbi:MAG TPA: sigma 54-interacting transcriptional regulator [Candidatus Limnocylindria bacterium]|nr:sigma 54-interacting transcriptional regulator [Candidatus Limnocylindria bacterium]